MSFNCPDCNTNIPGTNCAHELSRQMGWKNITNCYAHCHCGYPVRAKELRKNKFSLIDKDETSNVSAYIYCENPSGQGHVYFGTYDNCERGNGYTAKQMKQYNGGSLNKFERCSV